MLRENGIQQQVGAAQSVERTQRSLCLLPQLSTQLLAHTPSVEASGQTAELLTHTLPR